MQSAKSATVKSSLLTESQTDADKLSKVCTKEDSVTKTNDSFDKLDEDEVSKNDVHVCDLPVQKKIVGNKAEEKLSDDNKELNKSKTTEKDEVIKKLEEKSCTDNNTSLQKSPLSDKEITDCSEKSEAANIDIETLEKDKVSIKDSNFIKKEDSETKNDKQPEETTKETISKESDEKPIVTSDKIKEVSSIE